MKYEVLRYAICTSVIALVLAAPSTMSAKKSDAGKLKAPDLSQKKQPPTVLLIQPKGQAQAYAIGNDIDAFLGQYGVNKKKGSAKRPLQPLANDFVARGQKYGVDPRLIVAIAGAESTFGEYICTPNNAWNWFYKGHCTSPFDSWDSGMTTVTHFMRKSYILHGYDTIPKIAARYCAEGCKNWIPNVRHFYAQLGADENVIAWTPAAPTGVKSVKVPTPPKTEAGDAKSTKVAGVHKKTVAPPVTLPAPPVTPPVTKAEIQAKVPTPAVRAHVDKVDVPKRKWTGSLAGSPSMTVTAQFSGTTVPKSVRAVIVTADKRRTEVGDLSLAIAGDASRIYSGTVSLAGFSGPLDVEVEAMVPEPSGLAKVVSAGVSHIDLPQLKAAPSRWIWVTPLLLMFLVGSSFLAFRLTHKHGAGLQVQKTAA